MIVIPSVDIRGGRCVRLVQGDFTRETVFSSDPADVVTRFVLAGAKRVHLVDLDAARGVPDTESQWVMAALVAQLAHDGITAQVGGGVRTAQSAQQWFDTGAAYVVLGSLAVKSPERAEEICKQFPGQVLLGLDARDGVARAQGWTEAAGPAQTHLQRWRDWPAAGVIFTDVSRDGTLDGPNTDAIRHAASVYGGPLYASGGIAALDEIGACADAGAAGVIIGRAIYSGIIELRAALRRYPSR